MTYVIVRRSFNCILSVDRITGLADSGRSVSQNEISIRNGKFK